MEFFLVEADRSSGESYVFALGVPDVECLNQEVCRYFHDHEFDDVEKWTSTPIADIKLVPTTLEGARRLFEELRRRLETERFSDLRCCTCHGLQI